MAIRSFGVLNSFPKRASNSKSTLLPVFSAYMVFGYAVTSEKPNGDVPVLFCFVPTSM